MRCPTCAEVLAPGTSRCPTCGAAVSVSLELGAAPMQRCPRCSYTGQGVTYFSRPGHLALLVAASFFYAFPGLIFWLARRKHRVCPRCGLGWQYAANTLGPGPSPHRLGDGSQRDVEDALPSGGVKRQVLGTLLILLATIIVVVGIVEFEAAAILGGSMVGATGTGAVLWGWRAKQARRAGVMAGLQRKVLRLATSRGGTLTVTEVAADLNLSIPAAEKVLIAMDDGFRVRSEITPEGILLYEFPEVRHRPRLEAGPSGEL
jgi:hypothetical protein